MKIMGSGYFPRKKILPCKEINHCENIYVPHSSIVFKTMEYSKYLSHIRP